MWTEGDPLTATVEYADDSDQQRYLKFCEPCSYTIHTYLKHFTIFRLFLADISYIGLWNNLIKRFNFLLLLDGTLKYRIGRRQNL